MTELKTLELNRADIPTWTPYLSRYRAEWQIASAEQWKLPMGSSPWTTSCKSINHKLLVIPPLVMAVSHVWLKKKKWKKEKRKEEKKIPRIFHSKVHIVYWNFFFFFASTRSLGLNILSAYLMFLISLENIRIVTVSDVILKWNIKMKINSNCARYIVSNY